ncbi:MAG: GAF domain-containing sensor histidine kinase [Bacteroidota bacterium]
MIAGPEAPSVTLARLRRLVDVSVALNAIGDTARLLDYIAQATTDVLRCEAASILLFDEHKGILRFASATGDAGRQLVGRSVPLDGSLAGTTFRENRILHAADEDALASRDRSTDEETGFITERLLGVPMRIDGEPVGVIQALNPGAGSFDRADAEALLIVASQAAVAIRRSRHEEAIERISTRLAELDRLKTNFMAITSHELRTPLTAVQGFGQILAQDLRGDARAHADAVVRAGARMFDLVETLDVMAGTIGDVGSHPSRIVSVAALVRDVVQEEAPHASVDLPGPLLVEGDANRIRLAIRNLVANAVQFSPAGAPVAVRATVADECLTLSVYDQGRGLSASDVESIFEAYVQVADPDRRDHEGLGVGLTVARAIAVQHGGTLWAESDGLGEGAAFHMRLPLAP